MLRFLQFVKARAYYELGDYSKAADVLFEIVTLSNDEMDRKAIDKKLYLFEAKVNDLLGNSNIEICKTLLKLCPDCIPAYVFLRNDFLRNDLSISLEDEDVSELVRCFNDRVVSSERFIEVLSTYKSGASEIKTLMRFVSKKSA